MAAVDTLLAALAADPGDDFAWLRAGRLPGGAGPRARGRADPPARVGLRPLPALRRARPAAVPANAACKRCSPSGVEPVVPRLDVEVAGGVLMAFCLIPPGSFWMGSPDREPYRYANEGPRHLVRLTRGFWLGRTPITGRQWQAVGGEAASRRGEHPATGLSWDQLRDSLPDAARRPAGPSACRPRPSGSTPAAPARPPSISSGERGAGPGTSRLVPSATAMASLARSGRRSRTPGACTTCTATSGSGASTAGGDYAGRRGHRPGLRASRPVGGAARCGRIDGQPLPRRPHRLPRLVPPPRRDRRTLGRAAGHLTSRRRPRPRRLPRRMSTAASERPSPPRGCGPTVG